MKLFLCIEMFGTNNLQYCVYCFQFQALWESSQHYEAGTQFMEYVKRLPIPSGEGGTVYEPFVFESYNPDNK